MTLRIISLSNQRTKYISEKRPFGIKTFRDKNLSEKWDVGISTVPPISLLRLVSKVLSAASTRKYCPIYSQLFPMDNTALCQIGLVLHNFLILLIILVLSMTLVFDLHNMCSPIIWHFLTRLSGLYLLPLVTNQESRTVSTLLSKHSKLFALHLRAVERVTLLRFLFGMHPY